MTFATFTEVALSLLAIALMVGCATPLLILIVSEPAPTLRTEVVPPENPSATARS